MPLYRAPNMTRLSDSTLTGSAANFDLTSIPGTFKHLVIEYQMRSDRASNQADPFKMTFNNDGSSIYDYTAAQHDGSAWYYTQAAAAAAFLLVAEVSAATAAAGNAGSGTIHIPNYAGTTWQKEWFNDGVCVLGTTAGQVRRWVTSGNYRSTSAITRITLAPVNGSNFITGSRVTLYGLS